MPNRSTHQLPQTNDLLSGDRAYLVRETSPGVWVDRSFDPSALFMRLYSQTTNIDPADIPNLNTVPIEVVAAPASDQIIIPKFAVCRFLGWTTPWTSSSLLIGTSSLLNNSRYTMVCLSETGGFPELFVPHFTGSNLLAISAGDGLSVKSVAGLSGGDAGFSITVYYYLINA